MKYTALRYTVFVVLAVAGAALGTFATWFLFFAFVWGLQLPTSATLEVRGGLGIVQVASAILAWYFARKSLRTIHPWRAFLAGFWIATFGMSTRIQFFGWPGW